ncbi:MAG: VWA domain-containing protein [Deltaproteobacteria bacterium]|nr:VWA domain-containing protein [Deltaproteobacteria bacterium]
MLTSLDAVRWTNAHLWWVLLVPLALVPAYLAYEAFRRRIERAHSGRALVPRMVDGASGGRRIAVAACTLLALEFVGVAVMRPRYGLKEVTVRGAGVDIAIVLDASRSMKVADVSPDRITAATVEVARLLDMTRGDRVALVPFAGIAFVQTPLTLDHEVIKEYLRDLRVTDLPVPGTAIGRALALAKQALQVTPEGVKGSGSKAVVLFTDGEETAEGEPAKVAAELAEKGVRIYAVPVGTPAGQPIPVLDDSGRVTGTAREKDGVTPVLSKLDEGVLKDLAGRSGGRYFSLSGGADVAGAIAAEIAMLEKAEYRSQVDRLLEDRFQYPLGAAVALMVAAALLAGGAGVRRRGAAAAAVAALAVGAAVPVPADAKGVFERDHGGVADAVALLAQGRAGEAAKALEELAAELGVRPDLYFDLALARDRQGEHAQAVEAADKALSALRAARESRPDWPTEARILHAKGTILMRRAASEAAAKKDTREVRKVWRQAVEALSAALVADPAAEDTRRNLELAAGAAWPPCSKLDDPHEPNDTPDEARFLTPDPNTLTAKADLLLCPGNEDWFKLPLRAGETLMASVVAPAEGGAAAQPQGAPGGQPGDAPKPAATDLALVAADGQVFGGPAKQVRRRAIGAETAFLRVTGPKEEDGTPYVLDARVVPACPAGDDGMEPNDAREATKPLPDGDHGLRVCPGSDDGLTSTEKQGTQKQVVLAVPAGEGPLELEVWSADGAPVDVERQDGEEGAARAARLPKAEQDAPFAIRVFGGGQEGFYRLSVRDADGQDGGQDRKQDQQDQQDQQQQQEQQQEQQQQEQQGSRTMRELLDDIDGNDENLEAKEAERSSPYREWVPEKDW